MIPIINLFAYSAEVEDIGGRDYYPVVKEVIDSAEESIYVAMFIISLHPEHKDSKTYQLCNSLIKAKERGVNVKVVLDQNVDFMEEDHRWEIEGKNEEAYKYFKSNGVDVFYDDKYKYTHSKTIVIDEETVIIGSTNWSVSAFERNNESSVLIKSPELAKSIIEDIEKIEIIVPKIPFETKTAIKIDKTFLEDEELAGRMITKHDERVFDLYMQMIYQGKGKRELSFNYDLYAKYMGMDKMTPEAYRRQLTKSLRKLNEIYNLIDVEFKHGENAKVKIREYAEPQEDYFLIPEEFFKYGWNKILSQRAKHCYMINLFLSQEGDGHSWSLSRPRLSERFHIAIETISVGMEELKRMNLIEMEYSDIDEGYESRHPAQYDVLQVYDPVKNEQKLSKLEEKYGEKYKRARNYAKIVFKENDPVVIEEIINLILEYPDRIIRDAYKKVGKKAKDNPKRNQYYAVAIIIDQANKK